MSRSAVRFSLFVLAAAAASLAPHAQSVQPVSTSSGPDAILEAAAPANGLDRDQIHPWYIHGSWQILSQNQTTHQGSFEEWWGSPQQAKISVSANEFQQTRYKTAGGVVYTGSAVPPDNIVSFLDDAIRMPLPPAAGGLRETTVNQGGVALTCVSDPEAKPEESRPAGSLLSAYSACFAGSPPVLRMEAGLAVQALFNSLVRFEGRYLARDVRFILPSREQIAIHLDVIEPLNPAPESLFDPPATAQPLPARIDLPEGVLLPTRVAGHRPVYPHAARLESIQGTVELAAVIRKDGSMGDVKVVSAPPRLGQSAVVGVRTWRYRPYLVNGQPVEVETRIHVTFTCDGGPNLCRYVDEN
ncbi:MAG: energy transducer TonB [Acidobacteriaceae bacterium]